MYLQTVLIGLNIVVNVSFSRDKFENLCGVLETSAALDSDTPHFAGVFLNIKLGNPWLWNQEFSSKESRILLTIGIRNPQREIQNPRLS